MADTVVPKVTIIIPTYNQAAYLPNAINSALGQDYPNLEVIVADDCSSDDTRQVVEQYLGDSRLKYFRNDPNLGRVRNYKRALEEYATGEWVVNCDGDDYYTSEQFVSEVMGAINKHPDDNIVFAQGGQQVYFTHAPQRSYDELPPIANDIALLKDGQYFWQFPRITHFSHLTAIYKREVAVAINFYRHDISSTDRESFLRLALHGDVLLIKKVYGAWVQHGANFSQKLDFETRRENIAYITESYRYALKMPVDKKDLASWRKTCLVKYYKDWLSRVAMQKLPVADRLTELRKIVAFSRGNHKEIWYSADLYKTIISLSYKLL